MGCPVIRWKRIVCRVVEFSKRWGPYFFSGFVGSVVGIVPALIWLANSLRILIVAILGILAVISCVATIIALYYDVKDARKRDSIEKHRGDFHVGRG